MQIIIPNNVFIDTQLSLEYEYKDNTDNSVILLGPGVLAKDHNI